jgi:hypothetical protein
MSTLDLILLIAIIILGIGMTNDNGGPNDNAGGT